MSPRGPRAGIRLPPLDAASALSVINVLDALIAAIWRAHGHAIIELQTDLDAGATRTHARRESTPPDRF
jgi:hypothetical protein